MSAQRVYSWTVQNEMRGVLGRVSAGAARRILDSTNPRKQGWGARELGFFEGAGAGAIKIFGSSSSNPIIEKM